MHTMEIKSALHTPSLYVLDMYDVRACSRSRWKIHFTIRNAFYGSQLHTHSETVRISLILLNLFFVSDDKRRACDQVHFNGNNNDTAYRVLCVCQSNVDESMSRNQIAERITSHRAREGERMSVKSIVVVAGWRQH